MELQSGEVRVEDWTLLVLAGEWLHPDGDAYRPEPGSGEWVSLDGGDVRVEGPGGLYATIAWARGDEWSLSPMVPPRGRGDLGAFYVTTEDAPITRRDTELFLRKLLPELRARAAGGEPGA